MQKRQNGQALVEYIIVFTALLFLTLGLFEIGMMMRASFTLNDATFRAAREGAVSNASLNPMRLKVVEAMTPLEMGSGGSVGRYAAAYARTRLSNYTLRESLGGIRLDVLNPTREIFNSFSINQYDLNSRRNVRQIPNDNLNVRPSGYRRIRTRGQDLDVNLQDANLLKIRVHWCHELKVPMVNRLIYNSWGFLGNGNPHWRACAAKTRIFGRGNSFFIPLSSDSIVRMQSPVRCDGRSCNNLR